MQNTAKLPLTPAPAQMEQLIMVALHIENRLNFMLLGLNGVGRSALCPFQQKTLNMLPILLYRHWKSPFYGVLADQAIA
jgi:hypothetical protein